MSLIKALIVYDSAYGNTEKIAISIGIAISGDVKMLRADEALSSNLKELDFLIVGSPTQGFRATKPIQAFINSIPQHGLKGIDVAAFDTRIPASDRGTGLRLIMKMGGYAAPRIANARKKKGGKLAASPEGFFVKDKEGPLKEGELERAAGWAKEVLNSQFQCVN